MFDFLNKLSHNHSPPEQQQVIFEQLSSEDEEKHVHKSASQKQQLSKHPPSHHNSPNKMNTIDSSHRIQKKLIKRGDSIVGKMQIGQKLQLNQIVTSILQVSLQQSKKGLSGLLFQNIGKAKDERERKVYIREMARDQEQYLYQAGKSTKTQSSYLQQGLESTVNSIINQISKEIEICDMPIFLKRKKSQDADQQRKQEMLRLIKQRESELQSKIGELSVQFNQGEQAAERRANEMLSKEQFDPDNVKTKMAEQFVREKQREREEQKAKQEEMRERKRLMEEMVKLEQAERQERAKQEKHQKLMRQFAQKQLAKREEVEKARTEELNYKQFLKEYSQKKPLFKKKEEEYQQRLKEQKKERYHALKDKQAKYEPLNMELLEMHEERYEQLRREDRERKEAQLELAKQHQMLLKKQLDEKIYKGKFRYLVLQQMVDVQAKKREKEAQRQAILMKKQAYSLEVKQHFKPTVDPAKRHEIQQIIGSHRQRKRKFMTPNRVAYSDHYSTISSQNHAHSEAEADPKKEGEKYHRLFKQYIRRKIEQGEVKSDEEPQQKAPVHRPDYLKQLREKYQGRIPSKSTRLQRQIEKMREGEDYRALILKAQQFENKAKQRQVKLRNVSHVPEEEAQLQEDYLCAIKAKMQLINNMN